MLEAGYDFSFSGLKSAVHRVMERETVVTEDLAASFVAACMDVLLTKLRKAVETYSPRSAVIVGGVSASPILRRMLSEGALGSTQVVFPSLKYATDNAAMIGAAGWWQFTRHGPSAADIGMSPRLSLPNRA